MSRLINVHWLFRIKQISNKISHLHLIWQVKPLRFSSCTLITLDLMGTVNCIKALQSLVLKVLIIKCLFSWTAARTTLLWNLASIISNKGCSYIFELNHLPLKSNVLCWDETTRYICLLRWLLCQTGLLENHKFLPRLGRGTCQSTQQT